MTMRTATIDGIEMRWEEHASVTQVVLVHGIPTSPATIWAVASSRLPPSVIAPDAAASF